MKTTNIGGSLAAVGLLTVLACGRDCPQTAECPRDEGKPSEYVATNGRRIAAPIARADSTPLPVTAQVNGDLWPVFIRLLRIRHQGPDKLGFNASEVDRLATAILDFQCSRVTRDRRPTLDSFTPLLDREVRDAWCDTIEVYPEGKTMRWDAAARVWAPT